MALTPEESSNVTHRYTWLHRQYANFFYRERINQILENKGKAISCQRAETKGDTRLIKVQINFIDKKKTKLFKYIYS